MQTLSQLLDRINSIIWGNWLLIVLLGIGLLYTVLSGFIQVRRFPYIMRKTLLEPWKQKKAATKSGDDTSISSFQALCTAIARRRPRRDLLDVGGGLRRHGDEIRRNHPRSSLSCEG